MSSAFAHDLPDPWSVALIHSDLDESEGFHCGIEERVREIHQGLVNILPKQSPLPHHPHSTFTCRFFCVRFLKHHVPEVPERDKPDDFAPWIGFVTTLRQVHGSTKSVLRLCNGSLHLLPKQSCLGHENKMDRISTLFIPG